MTRDTSRRQLFGSGAALLLMAPVASGKAAELDGELLAVCAEFDALERQLNAMHTGGANAIADHDERDAAQRPLQERQSDLLDRMCELPARTPEGVLAKARSLDLWDKGQIEENGTADGYWDERMLASLMRDLLGRAGA